MSMLEELQSYPLPNPSFQWRNDVELYLLEQSETSWILYCDGMSVRDNFGYPIIFETSWDAKKYAKEILGHEDTLLTFS
jgi:hypothetical protein